MKNLCTALIFLLPLATSSQHNVLVDAQWLKDHLSDPDLVILQVNALQLDYDAEHIEGARFLWPDWLAPDSPLGSMNVPDPKSAAQVLGNLGVSNNSHVVICHVRNEVSVSARMLVTLEHLGMRGKVSFLNGGLEAWKKAGYPVTQQAPIVKKTKFKVAIDPVVVDKDYVRTHMASEGTVIVDARIKRYYDGEPTGFPRNGHITGAKNIPYPNLLDPATNMYKPVDSLFTYYNPVAGKEKELVTYCFIGQTASVVYLGGRILGYNMKLYDGSMQEWSVLKELPMETTKK